MLRIFEGYRGVNFDDREEYYHLIVGISYDEGCKLQIKRRTHPGGLWEFIFDEVVSRRDAAQLLDAMHMVNSSGVRGFVLCVPIGNSVLVVTKHLVHTLPNSGVSVDVNTPVLLKVGGIDGEHGVPLRVSEMRKLAVNWGQYYSGISVPRFASDL